MSQASRVKKLEQEKDWRKMSWQEYGALHNLTEMDALDAAEYLTERPNEYALWFGRAVDEEELKATREFIQRRRRELEAEKETTAPEFMEAEHDKTNKIHTG